MQTMMKSMVKITNQRFLVDLSKKLQKSLKGHYFCLCHDAEKKIIQRLTLCPAGLRFGALKSFFGQ